MLAEFVKTLADIITQAATPHILGDPYSPDRYYICNKGELTTLARADRPLNPIFSTLEDFARFLNASTDEPTIYHGPGLLTALFDANKFETAHLPLTHTRTHQQIMTLAKGITLTQPAIIGLLRHDLHDCIPPDILPAFRRLDFLRTSSGSRTIEHGRESLGKAIEAKVQQADSIPETFPIDYPIYQTPGAGLVIRITCAVDIDMAAERIILTPRPAEMALAEARTQAFIAERLGELCPTIPCYAAKVNAPGP